jgi:hypothetical protein
MMPWEMQSQIATPDGVKFYTEEWDGERFPDGRTKVSKDLVNKYQVGLVGDVLLINKFQVFFNDLDFRRHVIALLECT